MDGIKWDIKKEKNIISEKEECSKINLKIFKNVILIAQNDKQKLLLIRPKEVDFLKK